MSKHIVYEVLSILDLVKAPMIVFCKRRPIELINVGVVYELPIPFIKEMISHESFHVTFSK